ncbi:MAG: cupin domain-containing protein [Deltaproteobacteria bacterium]|jgi:quercetin dioxygenase-like cupin family protein|nr:cupin domain-containing protein [Deltaproteobacteria bacterium]
MKRFKTEDYVKMENPRPGESYRPEILTAEHGAKDLGGMFGLLPPGTQVPYHYHNKRESVIMIISGQGVEIMDGEKIPVSTGDVFFIPAGVKHTTVNTSDTDLRYLEFFTQPPVGSDFVAVTAESIPTNERLTNDG